MRKIIRIEIFDMFRFALISSFVLLSSLSSAQEVKISLADLEKLNSRANAADSLVIQISSLEKNLADSSKKISSQAKELVRLSKLVEQQKLEISKQNKKRGDIVKPYEDSLASLLKIITSKDTLISELQRQKSEFIKVQNKLNDLETFRKLYIDDIKSKEEPYLQLAYSKMDIDHINEVIMECKELNDPDLISLSDLFKDVLRRKNLYDEYVKSINVEYDSLKIFSLLQQKTELELHGNAVQKEEVDNVVAIMESYKVCMSEFKDIVLRISKFLNDNARAQGFNENLALDNVKYILNSDRVLYSYNKFSKVPHLVNLFAKYNEALMEAPTQMPQLEKEILNK